MSSKKQSSREQGTNPRALKTNPRAQGTNPRALTLAAPKPQPVYLVSSHGIRIDETSGSLEEARAVAQVKMNAVIAIMERLIAHERSMQKFLDSYIRSGCFTLPQAAVVVWRLGVKRIDYDPEVFVLVIT